MFPWLSIVENVDLATALPAEVNLISSADSGMVPFLSTRAMNRCLIKCVGGKSSNKAASSVPPENGGRFNCRNGGGSVSAPEDVWPGCSALPNAEINRATLGVIICNNWWI